MSSFLSCADCFKNNVLAFTINFYFLWVFVLFSLVCLKRDINFRECIDFPIKENGGSNYAKCLGRSERTIVHPFDSFCEIYSIFILVISLKYAFLWFHFLFQISIKKCLAWQKGGIGKHGILIVIGWNRNSAKHHLL